MSLISPKYVLLLTAGCSYQWLLTPLLAACTEFTISDSAIKQKLITERFFFLQEASHVNSYFLALNTSFLYEGENWEGFLI